MVRIAIVTGSTRPNRRGDQVARWVLESAGRRTSVAPDASYALVDLADFALPLLDEPRPAAIGGYRNAHTKRWSAAISSFDGFIFVIPEYNHSLPAAIKNAVDYLFGEWNDKAAGFVSYGLHGGVRAVEHLRLALGEVKVACVRSQVALSLFVDFEITDMAQPGTFRPADHHAGILDRLFDEVEAWSAALRPLRAPAGAERPA